MLPPVGGGCGKNDGQKCGCRRLKRINIYTRSRFTTTSGFLTYVEFPGTQRHNGVPSQPRTVLEGVDNLHPDIESAF